jgi:hypothetical protein
MPLVLHVRDGVLYTIHCLLTSLDQPLGSLSSCIGFPKHGLCSFCSMNLMVRHVVG